MGNKPEETSRFWKDVFLVVLGIVLGAVISWVTACEKDRRDRQSEKRDAVSILLAFIESESQMNKSLIKMLKESLQSGQPTVQFSTPEGLKWQHDPTVPRSLVERFTKLEGEILIKYLGYLQMYEQCGSFRDIVVRRTFNDQGVHRVDAFSLAAYATSLNGVEKSAAELRELIARYYGAGLLPQQGGESQ